MRLSALRLTRHSLLVTFVVVACGVSSHGDVAWADEKKSDEPETVAPVTFGAAKPAKAFGVAVGEPEVLAPIGFGVATAPTQLAPMNVGAVKPESMASIGFNLSSMKRDTALIQIKAGTLTMEEAWQSGALTYDNIADLFEHPTDPWIINIRQTDDGLNHRLIELLLLHERAQLENLPEVPQRVRLWLADYYQSRQNEKVVEVAESILTEAKISPTADDVKFQAIERMAWYYGKEKQWSQAAQQWARVPDFISKQDWQRADAAWLEAELWMLAGESGKAEKAFALVDLNKDKFFSGASLLTRASFAYRDGDDAKAAKLAQSAVESLESSQHSAAVGFRSQAQGIVDALERWKKEPLFSNSKQLRFDFFSASKEQDVLTQTVKVRSHKIVPLVVKLSANYVSAKVAGRDSPILTDENTLFSLFEEQEVAVTVARPDKAGALKTEINIISPDLSGFALQIPVEIVYNPFKLSSPSLFFGFVDNGKISVKEITVSASKPFRIIEVRADSPLLKASNSPSSATQHTIAVTIQGGSTSQILQGKIRIKTDLAAQEVIELPYYAYIQSPT